MLKMNEGILGQSKKIQKEKRRQNEKFSTEEKKELVELFYKKVTSSLDKEDNPSMTKNSKDRNLYIKKFNCYIRKYIPLYVCFFILTLFKHIETRSGSF